MGYFTFRNFNVKNLSEQLPLFVLGAICFTITLMCQFHFKIAKEIKPKITPSLLKSNYVSMIYGFGTSDRFRLVLRIFMLTSSPISSIFTTGLVLLGKQKSNPYLFLPWFFVTLRGLCCVQIENLLIILKELYFRHDQTYAFTVEDIKWSALYFTILFINTLSVAEWFTLYEVLQVFGTVWNSQFRDNMSETLKLEPSDTMDNKSPIELTKISSFTSAIDSYHTFTSICKFGLIPDREKDNSITKLDSLVALFKKETWK